MLLGQWKETPKPRGKESSGTILLVRVRVNCFLVQLFDQNLKSKSTKFHIIVIFQGFGRLMRCGQVGSMAS